MASWYKYFSGVPLENSGPVEFEPRWWENSLKNISRQRPPCPKVPDHVLEGTINQGMLYGPYAGTQCTSICLQSINWWYNQGRQGTFTQNSLDHIVLSGHILHVDFREKHKVSVNPDKRVSIEDLPKQHDFGSSVFYRQKNWKQYVSTTPYSDHGGMESLSGYLLGFADQPFGVLVTVGDYTQSIFYNRDKKWLLFDSHGSLKFRGFQTSQASCWEFDSVDALIAFLLINRPHPDGYCLVTRPVIVVKPPKSTLDTNINAMFSKSSAVNSDGSSSCPVEMMSDEGYDDDPYVSMMAGFGGY